MNIVRWESPRDVVALLKSLVPESPSSLLVLGAGRMELESEVFDLKKVKALMGVEWCDADRAWLEGQYPGAVLDKKDLSATSSQNWRDFREDGGDKIEVITAFDIIEHLPKDSCLVTELAKFSCKVLIFMPVQSALLREPEVLAEIQLAQKQKDEVLHCHLSLWTPEELEALGFTVWYDPDYHRRRTRDPNFGIEGAMVAYKEVK